MKDENPETWWTCERCYEEVRAAHHPHTCPNPKCRASRGSASSWYRVTQ